MPSAQEVPVLVRRFQGVNKAVDPAFLGPGVLQSARNWVPDLSYVLAKRRGSTDFGPHIGTGPHIDAMLRVYDDAGNRYLYVALSSNGPNDFLALSTNEAGFVAVPPNFTTVFGRIGLAAIGSTLYAGNGVDALHRIPFGGASTSLSPLASANDTGQTATTTADSSSSLLGGVYSYRWAVYDSVLKAWTAIGAVRTVALTGASWFRIAFLSPQVGAPAYVLGANELWHLFIAPADQEIEGAHDHTPAGIAAATTVNILAVTIDGTAVPTPSTVTRTGRFLVPHRGRLFIAGDNANPRDVSATSVLVPGLEQAIFDQGDFFPANARLRLPTWEAITGMAVATTTTAERAPQSPLAITTLSSTWLLFGDILDDPNATLVQASGVAGASAHATLVPTPYGLIFQGPSNVYLLPPSGQEPIPIGDAIAPALRNIPAVRRSFACAMYHRGFYKLWITPAGGTTNTESWWLDLRRGLDPSAWWGPHDFPAIVSVCVGRAEPAEDDRGFAAVDNTGIVLLLDQPGVYQDNGSTITSVLRTGRIDGGQPFERKRFTRTRLMAKTTAPTGLNVTVITDGAQTASGVIPLAGAAGAVWDTADWDTSDFGAIMFSEGEYIAPTDRPRGQGFEIEFQHAEALEIDLRDCEMRYLPVERPVGSGPASL